MVRLQYINYILGQLTEVHTEVKAIMSKKADRAVIQGFQVEI